MKNVILLTIDCCRKDVLGMYGGKEGLTPFIDSLREKSIVFHNAQAVGPYTQASFPGILASSYFLEYGFQKKCPTERVLISEVLKKRGIFSAAFHSNPYLCGFFGWNRGWDVFMDSMEEKVSPKNPYLKGDAINKKVENWLSFHATHSKYPSFFLWVHYMDIHEPYIPKRRHIDAVDGPIDLNEDDMFRLFKDILLERDVSNPKNVKTLKNLYKAHIKEVDEYVEDFFAILKRLDVLENSTIIITADHGDEFNEHGSLSHDSTMYSELIEVPVFIYNEELETAGNCETLVSNLDIPPTVTHLFNVEPSEKWGGLSLLPLGEYHRMGCFGEAAEKKGRMKPEPVTEAHYYREGNLKIIYREEKENWEMYDLSKDPKESENIVERSSQANRMKEKVRPRIKRAYR